jgi:23S rRNA (adenine2503-C2)-methyltransferase
MRVNIKQLREAELVRFVEGLGQEPYRARQIINWLYKRYASSFDEMTDLSKELREELNRKAFIPELRPLKSLTSRDGTKKFLFELDDGETIESVLIPEGDRNTLCISSQVGCRRACRFCITGRLGLRRDLKAFEIVDQVIAVKKLLRGLRITNIVFMGMGEPLDNTDEVIEAIKRITGPMGLSKKRITLSTVGIIPEIRRLYRAVPGINLAISLNATTDETRNRLMPVNREYPLRRLIDVCRSLPIGPRRRITFEYILIDGVNDSDEDAKRLLRLLRGIRAKVNLIPYNPVPNHTFKRPPDERISAFQRILRDAGITTLIRKSKGVDIEAACGQLRASYLRVRGG